MEVTFAFCHFVPRSAIKIDIWAAGMPAAVMEWSHSSLTAGTVNSLSLHLISWILLNKLHIVYKHLGSVLFCFVFLLYLFCIIFNLITKLFAPSNLVSQANILFCWKCCGYTSGLHSKLILPLPLCIFTTPKESIKFYFFLAHATNHINLLTGFGFNSVCKKKKKEKRRAIHHACFLTAGKYLTSWLHVGVLQSLKKKKKSTESDKGRGFFKSKFSKERIGGLWWQSSADESPF